MVQLPDMRTQTRLSPTPTFSVSHLHRGFGSLELMCAVTLANDQLSVVWRTLKVILVWLASLGPRFNELTLPSCGKDVHGNQDMWRCEDALVTHLVGHETPQRFGSIPPHSPLHPVSIPQLSCLIKQQVINIMFPFHLECQPKTGNLGKADDIIMSPRESVVAAVVRRQ